MSVELYHFWSSVCSVRARMALEEKGVAWESRYIDLFRFDQMTPEYLAINPDGVVPTLVHDGQPIRESMVIVDYVDDAFPGPALKPDDPLRIARMREFMHFCEDVFPAVVLPTFAKYVLPKLQNRWTPDEIRAQAERRPAKFYREVHGRAAAGGVDDAEIAECHARLESLLDRMETLLADGPWLAGREISLADIGVAPYLFRMLALGLDGWWAPDVRPRVHDWYARLGERPAFRTAVEWPDESGQGYEEVGLTTKR